MNRSAEAIQTGEAEKRAPKRRFLTAEELGMWKEEFDNTPIDKARRLFIVAVTFVVALIFLKISQG